jgi:hypothetical protein
MRVNVSTVGLANVDPTTNQTGSAIRCATSFAVSMVVVPTGTPGTGTVKLQVHNGPSVAAPATGDAGWIDLPSASVTLSGTTTLLVAFTNICHNWIRVVYTKAGSPSTGSITATLILPNHW